MDKRIDDFASPVGKDAAHRAIEAYKKKHGANFKHDWEQPMYYSSGYTAAILAHAFNRKWIVPLKRRVLIIGIGLIISLCLTIVAFMYLWSLTDFGTFLKFLVAFVPSIAALVFSFAKTYKTWAEAKKTLSEARAIEDKAQQESKVT